MCTLLSFHLGLKFIKHNYVWSAGITNTLNLQAKGVMRLRASTLYEVKMEDVSLDVRSFIESVTATYITRTTLYSVMPRSLCVLGNKN